MAYFSIFSQLILSVYVLYEKINIENIASWGVIGLFIIHQSLYLLIHSVGWQKVGKSLYIVDWLLLVGGASLIDGSFWVLVVATSIEVSVKYRYRAFIIVDTLLIGYIGIAFPNLFEEQVILYLFTALSLVSIALYEKKLESVKRLNEELQDQLHRANQNINIIQKQTKQIEETAKLQERNLLVQKLHDKIGHTLSANIMQLEATKIILKQDTQKANEMLEIAILGLREGMEDIRYTLRNIKPEQAEMGINKIKQMLDHLAYQHSIHTDLSFEGDIETLGADIWYVIQQNLQECITNLLKYSKADNLKVRIAVYNKMIQVQFTDNGLPIEGYKKGLGLMGMEERTQSLGGRLVINTNNGFDILMVLDRRIG